MRKIIGGLLVCLLFLVGIGAGAVYHKEGLMGLEHLIYGRAGTGISIRAEGSVPSSTMKQVQDASDAFQQLAEEQMGTPIHQAVDVFVCENQEDYQQTLQREFDLSADDAKQIADVSGGWTGASRQVTAINASAGVMNTRSDHYATTGHELFHQLQYELSRGHDTDEQALFWLEEGSADYIGAMVAERLHGRSAAKWKKDALDDLLTAPNPAKPQDIQHCTAEQRQKLMAREYHTYSLADVMTAYLLDHYAKGKECAQIAAYFRQLGDSDSGEQAFEQTFGLPLDAFLQEFSAWWAQEQTAGAQVSITARDGVSGAIPQELQRELAASQQLLARQMGMRWHGEYDMILAKDKADLEKAAMQALDIDEKKAKALAASSLWIENGSTILVNASQLGDSRQLSFSSAVLVLRAASAEISGQTAKEKDIAWLTRGMGYLFGTRRVVEMGAGDMAAYHRTWRIKLQQAGRIPELHSIASDKGYQEAVESLGDETVSALSELACLELNTKYGWSSYARYLKAMQQTQNAEKAFRSVYGVSSGQFAQQFMASWMRGI